MKTAVIDRIGFLDNKDKKLLLAVSKNNDTWFIPGEKREPGEIDNEALIREIKEELSIDIKPETITYFTSLEGEFYGKPKGTKVKIAYYIREYIGEVHPHTEIKKLGYFTFSNTP